MRVKRVTRDMVRMIKEGESATYTLPTVSACYSARITVTHVGQITNRKYSCHIEVKKCEVTIFRDRLDENRLQKL